MVRLTEKAKQVLTEERRAQILGAAAQVFSDHGYHEATIRQIADRAGLAEGTIYLYFPGKRDLLLSAWEHVAISSLFPLLDQASRGADDEEFMTTIVTNRFELFRLHAAFFRLVMQQADVDPELRKTVQTRIQTIKAILGDHLRRRIAEGGFRRVSVPIVQRAIAGMMMGAAVLDANDPDPLFERYTIPTIAREMTRLILYGLVADGERHRDDRQKKPRVLRAAKGAET
jgi:AcrR family transcriptional regulator